MFAPLVSSTMRVEPAWIDYNGHLNMAYYLVLFDRAVDEAFAVLGIGPGYVEARRRSCFVAEAHVVFQRELTENQAVRVTFQLIGRDEKRIHAYLEMRHAQEGWVAASCEKVFLHVDTDSRKVCAFPSDIGANLDVMQAAHARLARPEALGRTVGLARHPRAATGTRH